MDSGAVDGCHIYLTYLLFIWSLVICLYLSFSVSVLFLFLEYLDQHIDRQHVTRTRSKTAQTISKSK